MRTVRPSEIGIPMSSEETGMNYRTRGKRGFCAREKSPLKSEADYIHRREMFRKELKYFLPISIISLLLLITYLCFCSDGLWAVILGNKPIGITFFGNIIILVFLLYMTVGTHIYSYFKYFKKKK